MTTEDYLLENLHRFINKDWEYTQIEIMQEYARLMCDKQKEICYINAATKRPV